MHLAISLPTTFSHSMSRRNSPWHRSGAAIKNIMPHYNSVACSAALLHASRYHTLKFNQFTGSRLIPASFTCTRNRIELQKPKGKRNETRRTARDFRRKGSLDVPANGTATYFAFWLISRDRFVGESQLCLSSLPEYLVLSISISFVLSVSIHVSALFTVKC